MNTCDHIPIRGEVVNGKDPFWRVNPVRHGQTALEKTDSRRWPYPEERLADDVLVRDGAPEPAVAGVGPIVAHHEVGVLRNLEPRYPRVEDGKVRPGLLQGLAVHVHDVAFGGHDVTRQT